MKLKHKIPHQVPADAAEVYDNLVYWARRFSQCPSKIVWHEKKRMVLLLRPRNNVLREAAVRILKAFSVPCYGVPGPDRIGLAKCESDPDVPSMVYAEWECE